MAQRLPDSRGGRGIIFPAPRTKRQRECRHRQLGTHFIQIAIFKNFIPEPGGSHFGQPGMGKSVVADGIAAIHQCFHRSRVIVGPGLTEVKCTGTAGFTHDLRRFQMAVVAVIPAAGEQHVFAGRKCAERHGCSGGFLLRRKLHPVFPNILRQQQRIACQDRKCSRRAPHHQNKQFYHPIHSIRLFRIVFAENYRVLRLKYLRRTCLRAVSETGCSKFLSSECSTLQPDHSR